MLRVTKGSAILFLVGALISYYAPSSLFSVLEDIGFLGLLVSLFYYTYHFLNWLQRRLLWNVRNKIMVSHAFIGIIPVVILAFIAWLASRLVLGQMGGLYLENELKTISDTLHRVNQETVLAFYGQGVQTERALESLLAGAEESLPPRTAIRLLSTSVKSHEEVPDWTRKGFHGLVWDSGTLYFRSVVPFLMAGTPHFLAFELPFDDDLNREIEERTSIRIVRWTISPNQESPEITLWSVFSGQDQWTNILWIHPLTPSDWATGEILAQRVEGVVLSVPLKTLYEHYFTQTSGLGPYVLYAIAVLGLVFVLVEVVSFFIGIAIARRITGSIHDLYTGTRNIQEGNFSYRIPAKDRDQLDSLAGAFNAMSESMVQLMAEVSAREWLEKEVEIAREVQAQLFPQRVPVLKGFQLAGACLPARRVSGDYYDFIPRPPGQLNTIIADISGKGISAALLMASLVSMVRTHLIYQPAQAGGTPDISGAVAEINRQLYSQTPPDKFATLVLTCVDADHRTLTYCNAGHNAPLLFSNGEVSKLDKGGLVPGLFEHCSYEEETISLREGDVVVFYTDGVVECENPHGEQLEEERLVELIRMNLFLTAEDIQKLIFDRVSEWTAGGSQADDVTVVVLKAQAQIGNR